MHLKKRIFLTLIFVLVMCCIYLISHQIMTTENYQVDGWTRNVSRNTNDYISEDLKPYIMPDNFCTENEKALLLVMVSSKPDNVNARNAIRETWGRKYDNMSLFFLLGETPSNLVQIQLEKESQRFGDIIQERFLDTYNNLTIKSVNMLKLFNKHCLDSYNYLMKVDDDTFINIKLILKMLANLTHTKNVLLGKLMNNTSPFRDSSSKWFVPYELYAEEKYPNYLCGPAYIMSPDVVEKLYSCAQKTPIFYIEDVYVTGICASKMNITPHHNPNFTCTSLADNCLYKKLYSVHYMVPDVMRKSYKYLETTICPINSFSDYIWKWFNINNLLQIDTRAHM